MTDAKILIARDPLKPKGSTDSWVASCQALPRKGIGRTWGEALESLVRSNLPEIGFTELRIEDPTDEANPVTTWKRPEIPDAQAT